jgi:ketosteroid isomerase-like protein
MLWPMAITPKQKIMKMTTLFGKVLLAGIILFSQAGFAQTITGQTAGFENAPNGKIIKAWYTAWEQKDWNVMTQILADGFTFSSPLDDHIKIDAVKERCWPNAGKFKTVDVQQVIMNGDAVFVIANGYTTADKFFRNCDYFTVKNGKIITYECFFGPGINFPNNSAK